MHQPYMNTKRTYSTFLLFTLVLLGMQGCKKEEKELNLNLTPANALFAPSDNLFVRLQPATSASVVFEWEQAKSEEGTLVMYQIAFDKEGGDFSNPVAKQLSDGGGAQNRLTLSHKDLNRIASQAGIAALGSGKLKWAVLSSKGPHIVQSQNTRTVEVTRPAGFAELPAAVYLSGGATEWGDDPAQAMAMKKNSEGVFEIYTSLKDGNLRILDKAAADGKAYSLASNFSALQEGGETTITGGQKVYRLVLDFNNAAVQVTEIVEVGLWFSPEKKVIVTLPYVGNGVWKVENTPIEFFQEGWGRDERYKFRLTVKDAEGTEGTEFMGSVNADNSRPDASTPESFYYLVPVNNSDYDFTFKFRGELDGANADVSVLLSPNLTNYTHRIIRR